MIMSGGNTFTGVTGKAYTGAAAPTQIDDPDIRLALANLWLPFTVTYLARSGPVLLFEIAGANFQLTTDQPLFQVYAGTSYAVTEVVARRRTGAASVACAGGLYDAASKGGNAIIAAAQSWVTLASGVIVKAALAAIDATTLFTATPILSLTTGSTAAITADVAVYGYDLT